MEKLVPVCDVLKQHQVFFVVSGPDQAPHKLWLPVLCLEPVNIKYKKIKHKYFSKISQIIKFFFDPL